MPAPTRPRPPPRQRTPRHATSSRHRSRSGRRARSRPWREVRRHECGLPVDRDDMDLVEVLVRQRAEHRWPLLELRSEHGVRHPIVATAIAVPDLGRGTVDGDGDARHAGGATEIAPGAALPRVERERVDDGRQSASQPPGRDLLDERERVGGRGQVVRSIADDGTEVVRRDDLVRRELRCRPRRLARASRADEHHQARRRQDQRAVLVHPGIVRPHIPPPAARHPPVAATRGADRSPARSARLDPPGGARQPAVCRLKGVGRALGRTRAPQRRQQIGDRRVGGGRGRVG